MLKVCCQYTYTHNPALMYTTTQTHPHRRGLRYATHTLITSLLSLSERGFQTEVEVVHWLVNNVEGVATQGMAVDIMQVRVVCLNCPLT